MIEVAADRVGQAVVAYVRHDKKVGSADRFPKDALGLAGAETRALAVNQIIICFVVDIQRGFRYFIDRIFTERNDIVIDFAAQIPTALHRYDLQRGNGQGLF